MSQWHADQVTWNLSRYLVGLSAWKDRTRCASFYYLRVRQLLGFQEMRRLSCGKSDLWSSLRINPRSPRSSRNVLSQYDSSAGSGVPESCSFLHSYLMLRKWKVLLSSRKASPRESQSFVEWRRLNTELHLGGEGWRERTRKTGKERS